MPCGGYSDWVINPAGSSVVSDHRLKTPDTRKFHHRLRTVVIHELGHNMGLPHCPGLERKPSLKDTSKYKPPDWESSVLHCIPATLVKTAPGKKYNYSNIGYAILGLALERAAKKPYMALITENIFAPLQMGNSYFIVPPDKMEKLARGLSINADGKVKQIASPLAHGYILPAGGIYSTVNDILKFLMANMGFYNLCNENNRALMQTGVMPPLPYFKMLGIKVLSIFLFGENKNIARTALHSKYGMGFSVCHYKGMNIVEHSGCLTAIHPNFLLTKKASMEWYCCETIVQGKQHYSFFPLSFCQSSEV